MKKKLLIIEDNEQDRKIMKRFLASFNFSEILIAESGEEGLKIFKECQPYIVITDTQLPGMDGFEICAKIKEIGQENVKIIMMTGMIDSIDGVKARKSGADDYCVKTSDYEYLLKAVQALV